jgi:hypothetical protein
MHPIDAVLTREGKENNPEARTQYTSLYRNLHRALRNDVFSCPPEFITRRLALIIITQYNIYNPTSTLQIQNLAPSDLSFLSALSQIYSSLKKSGEIDKAVSAATKNFVFASEEQQAKVENWLLAAEKLQLGLDYVEKAKSDILETELEDDKKVGEGVFEELVERGKGAEEGVVEMILQLVGKVMDVVGEVEVPDDCELGVEERSETGEETSQSGVASGEVREGWYVEVPSLNWAKDFDGIDAKEHHEYHVEKAVGFLNRCIEMVEDLTKLELWDVLDECRKILKQAKGKDIVEEDDEWPSLEERSINYRGGLGDAVVSTLVEYHQHGNADNGGAIDHRVYHKAMEFVDLVETRLKPEECTRPQWCIKDEWRNYYEQTIPSIDEFTERLDQYATKVEDKDWEFDERVLESLEDLIEQGKRKVDADAEEDEDESLSLRNSFEWGEHGKMSVLIRGYSKLLKDEEKQPHDEVLQLAQIIIDRANKQYEESHSEGGCECCGHQLEENLDGGGLGASREGVILCTFGPSDEDEIVVGIEGGSDEEDTVVGGGPRALSPIDEDPEAEAASEGESEVIHGGGHSLVLTEDGEERCEVYTIES